MKTKMTIGLAAVLLCSGAQAACFGTGQYRTCNDDAGNTYNVQNYGNTTSVQGSNARTGNNWSQETYRSGNTSSTYGRDADGNTWNAQTYKTPGGSTTYGTDSKGNSFSRSCNQFGCF